MKNTLVESSGQVNGCIAFPDGGAGGATVPQGSDNANDAGGFIEAADSLWRATANSGYATDAELTADAEATTANDNRPGLNYLNAPGYMPHDGTYNTCCRLTSCARHSWPRHRMSSRAIGRGTWRLGGITADTGYLIGMQQQYSRQHVIDLLKRMGHAQLADEASRVLPDPVDVDQASAWLMQHGLTHDGLISRMGGSP